jgi:hypothetical protein
VGTSTRFSQTEFTSVRLPKRVSFSRASSPALIDAETWSAVRDQRAANTTRHQSKIMQPSRAYWRAC